MLMAEPNASLTDADSGIPSDQYKRAVLHPPPARFSVEFLVSTKSNGSYHHGMHISPVLFGGAPSISSSISSRRSVVEYDIWRRWEDCLWFQDTLEKEYTRSAREKKTRLQQGKGVKAFNGMYKQDMASSWESLPPGPDPNSIAQDIHGYLPRLTKKGTLFRASQATIEMRQKEFRTLIETLFSDDMPALIQEIRASTIVTDFFGLWRRDFDNLDRPSKGVRSSVTNSVFSSYFSASSTSVSVRSGKSISSSNTATSHSLPNSPAKRRSISSRGSTERPRSVNSDMTDVSRYPQSSKRSSISSIETTTDVRPISRPRRRPVSSSSDSSSAHSDGGSDSSSTSSMTPAIVEDVPFVFGHNPQLNDRPSSILEVLPEERDMLSKSHEYQAAGLLRRPRTSAMERRANRSWSIVEMPSRRKINESPEHNVRESWQTIDSLDEFASEMIAGLNLSVPRSIKDNKYRQSMASISTFMTTDSADAVIPQRGPTGPESNNNRSSTTPSTRMSTALTLSDFEIYSDYDDDTDSMLHRRSILDSSSILDSFPRPNSYLPESYRSQEYDSSSEYDNRPEMPTAQYADSPGTPDSTRTSFETPPSPTSTISTAYTFSTIVSTISPGAISIKAIHNCGIILLRGSRDMALAEVRQLIYNKFVGQEGIPLSNDFTISFVPSSQRKQSLPLEDDVGQNGIHSDMDWERTIMSMTGSKVTLRILDPK